MIRLSPPDPPQPGTIVRVRPVSEWAGTDPGDRPLECEYDDPTAGFRRVQWTGTHDAMVGEHEVGSISPLGLPRLGRYQMHPDWLELVRAVPGPAPCTCDTFAVLMVRGCVCGAISRWR